MDNVITDAALLVDASEQYVYGIAAGTIEAGSTCTNCGVRPASYKLSSGAMCRRCAIAEWAYGRLHVSEAFMQGQE